MFDIAWAKRAFSRMQELVSEYPQLKNGFKYTLETLTLELARAAATWGESRTGNFRLGFVGILSVLIRVDMGTRLARIVDLKLLPRFRGN